VLRFQQQEDEEMLVPHSDLAENNHQPMDGIVLVFLLISVLVQFNTILDFLSFVIFFGLFDPTELVNNNGILFTRCLVAKRMLES
jgi:hypothetical protein